MAALTKPCACTPPITIRFGVRSSLVPNAGPAGSARIFPSTGQIEVDRRRLAIPFESARPSCRCHNRARRARSSAADGSVSTCRSLSFAAAALVGTAGVEPGNGRTRRACHASRQTFRNAGRSKLSTTLRIAGAVRRMSMPHMLASCRAFRGLALRFNVSRRTVRRRPDATVLTREATNHQLP